MVMKSGRTEPKVSLADDRRSDQCEVMLQAGRRVSLRSIRRKY